MRNFNQAAVDFVLNAKRIEAVVAAGVNEMAAHLLRLFSSRLHYVGSDLPGHGGLDRHCQAIAVPAQEPHYAGLLDAGLPGSWRSTRCIASLAFTRAA